MPPKRKSVKRKVTSSSTPLIATSNDLSPAPPPAVPPAKRQKRVYEIAAVPKVLTRTRNGSTRSSSHAPTPVIASASESVTENGISLATGGSEHGLKKSSLPPVSTVSSIPLVSTLPESSTTSNINATEGPSSKLGTVQNLDLPTSDEPSDASESFQTLTAGKNIQNAEPALLSSHVQPSTATANGSSASSTPSKRTPSRRPPIFADAMRREESAGTAQDGTREDNSAVQSSVADVVPLTTQQQVQIDQKNAQLRDLMLKRMQQDRAQLRAQQAATTTAISKSATSTPGTSTAKANVTGRTISSSLFDIRANTVKKPTIPQGSTGPSIQRADPGEAAAQRERAAKREVLLGRLKEIEKEIKVLAEQEAQASRRMGANVNDSSPNLAQCHAQPSMQKPSSQSPKQETSDSNLLEPDDPLMAAGFTSQLPMNETQRSATERAEAFKQLLEQHRMEISLGLRKDSPYFPARQGVTAKLEEAASGNAIPSPSVLAAPQSTVSPLFQTSQMCALSPYHQMHPYAYPASYDISGPSSAVASNPRLSTSPNAVTGSLPPYGQPSASAPPTSALLAELARLTGSIAPSHAGTSNTAGLGSMAPYPPSITAFGQYTASPFAGYVFPQMSSSMSAAGPFTGSQTATTKNELPYNPPTSSDTPASILYYTSIVKPETPAMTYPLVEPLDKGKGRAKSPIKTKSSRAPKKSAEPAEKRPAKKRNKCPVAVADRAERVKEQRMFMVHRERDLENLRETCSVLGSTGNVYTVEFGQVPSCTCPDYFKGNHCKHIIFVALKVMRISETSDLWYQKAYLRSELEEIFAKAPVNQFNSAQASADVQKAFRQHMGLEPASAEESKEKDAGDDLRDDEGKRKPVEGDECPICADEMADGGRGANELVYDLGAGGCGKVEGLQSKQGKKATCVYCRHAWADTAAGGKGKGTSMDMKEGYMNMADLAGISKRRDTSTYYHGPMKGKKRWESRYGEDDDDW
ncbi:hypothetical protein QFC22_003644 [Naganishia vaughanmartiniae]|uniref:Uncharacterized protein n=1 Tax=Naganishia vaughanmartiniae TaxID=1424756 RepID=A0ACC2X558_9TREE|nr:hypothetical protein QFC22_003644 [Naganishia vaughanmartiniae]